MTLRSQADGLQAAAVAQSRRLQALARQSLVELGHHPSSEPYQRLAESLLACEQQLDELSRQLDDAQEEQVHEQ
ncbi:MAG TPA: hypothetical protein VGB55_03350 [Tepidisphaeraceae bacterium]